MHLLVPKRTILALRRTTSLQVARLAATRATKQPRSSKKGAAAPLAAAAAAAPSTSAAAAADAALVDHLWALSRMREGGMPMQEGKSKQLFMEEEVKEESVLFLPNVIRELSYRNEFAEIGKILEKHRKWLEAGKTTGAVLVTEVLWAAVHAKSLGALTSPIVDWIEAAVLRIPEPPDARKEFMIWMLSIIRDDWPMLQQLQQTQKLQHSESKAWGQEIGPEMERERVVRYAALGELQRGKDEEFKSLWSASRTPLLATEGDERQLQVAAVLHRNLLQESQKRKLDPSMLRWYADQLARDQRTAIMKKPDFKKMLEPIVRKLGGSIEKWKQNDEREGKLRKWRSDYSEGELNSLVQKLVRYLKHRVTEEKHGSIQDYRNLVSMLDRLRKEKREDTVVIDWLNLFPSIPNGEVENLLQPHQLVFVGRKKSTKYDLTASSPPESSRFRVMEVSKKNEIKQELDDLCSIILAVATRSHLVTNDTTRPHIAFFKRFLKLLDFSRRDLSGDILQFYLNDAVLRHGQIAGKLVIQPMSEYSKAAQWIDKEKKELAFTVCYPKPGASEYSLLQNYERYSLYIK